MATKKILLVEDDPRLARYTADFLEQAGFEVEVAQRAVTALASLARAPPDAVLLDLTLPGMDGLELARQLRARGQVPIVMVTARTHVEDRIAGLELGADDYLSKPYDPRELLARLRAVLRRSCEPREPGGATAVSPAFRTGELELAFSAREARLRGRRLELTTLEFDLLAALARSAGRALRREELLDALRGASADEVFDRAVDVTVSRVRQKLEVDPRSPEYLKTVRQVGYLLAVIPPRP